MFLLAVAYADRTKRTTHKYGHIFRLEANGRINSRKAGIIAQKFDVYLINAHLMKEFKTIIGKAANMIQYAS